MTFLTTLLFVFLSGIMTGVTISSVVWFYTLNKRLSKLERIIFIPSNDGGQIIYDSTSPNT